MARLAKRLTLLTIDKRYIDEMIAHSVEEDPLECCGILAGENEEIRQSYRITNTAKSPYLYLMDPQEHLNADLDAERKGWQLMAFYHSHTHSPAYPSPTDVRMALQSGYFDFYYVLVSLENKEDPDIRVYNISEAGEIEEREFRIA